MTIPTIKTDVDTDIRQKVAASSIKRDEVADLFDATLDEIKSRGVKFVANTAALSTISGTDFSYASVENNGFYKWESSGTPNGTDIFAASGGGVFTRIFKSVSESNINDLSDINISSPSNDQVLKYNGSNWVNSSAESEVFVQFKSVDNTDRTSDINTIINNVNVHGIIFDSRQNIVINGVVTIPAGKYIRFEGNTKIIGTGTINGGIIEANSLSYIFDIGLTVNPQGVKGGWFSARWVGANPINADNYTYLQKAIDICTNKFKLYIPGGSYNISKGLFVGIPNQQVQITISGEIKSQTQTNNETVLNCTHNNNFAIGIQIGKGCEVSNINIKGVNQLNYSINTAFAVGTTYIVNGCRDNGYSPYAGIVLDPFHTNTPVGDRYPGFESYYPLYTSTGGSTSCYFNNLMIDGFVVGRVLSPNGSTFNNESHKFSGNWLYNCKVAYVSCNSQERNVIIEHELLSNSIKTGYATYGYGAGFGDPPILNDINCGSSVYELFHFPGTGYAPYFTANLIHAEVLYRIGTVGVRFNISNCKFLLSPVNEYGLALQSWTLDIMNVTGGVFNNCEINRADNNANMPFRIKVGNQAEYKLGLIKFINCDLDYPSVHNTNSSPSYHTDGYQQQFEFDNCKLYQVGYRIGLNNSYTSGRFDLEQFYQRQIIRQGQELIYGYGDNDGYKSYTYVKHKVLSIERKDAEYYNVQLTVSGSTATFDKSLSGIGNLIVNGDMIISKDYTGTDRDGVQVKGVIGSVISISGDTVTLRVIEGVSSGTYNISIMYFQTWHKPFVGSTTSGSNVITGISSIDDIAAFFRVSSPYFPQGTYIVSYDNALHTAVMSTNANATKSNVIFSTYDYDETYYFVDNPNTSAIELPIKSGTICYNLNEESSLLSAVCTKSGTLNTTNTPLFLARYDALEGTEASAIPSNMLVHGLDIYVKSTNGVFTSIGQWVYNGTAWVKVGSSIENLNDLNDVVITSPSNGQILKHNGTNWINDDSAFPQNNIVLENTIDGWTNLLTLEANSIAGASTGSLTFKTYNDASNRVLYGELSNLTQFSFGPGSIGFTGIDLGSSGILGSYHADLTFKLNFNSVNPTTAIKFRVEDLGYAPLSVWQTGEVSIGSAAISSPTSSAQLEVSSTTKGFLPPRMTSTQASAISSPAEGLLVYVTDTNGTFTTKGWWGYNGATWQQL